MGGAQMIKKLFFAFAIVLLAAMPTVAQTKQAPLRVLGFYSNYGEFDHSDFGVRASKFFAELAKKDHFQFDVTTNWDDSNLDNLKKYQIVLWFDDSAHTPQQRAAFEQYMEQGGGWMGFHAAAYNDSSTNWPWFVQFLGGTVFLGNSWPPLPAVLDVDDKTSPITRHLPAHFLSPDNEWYTWTPGPRANKDVKVLLTLNPSNFPLGMKDTLTGGDVPAMWSNTRYRMVYSNMGHGDKIFTSPLQNRLFEDSLLWLATKH
jgi:type 1 glutamine amidotransferase